jgi:hypothetical protein
VGSLYGIALNFWLALHERKYRFFTGAGMYIMLGIFGALMATLAAFIIVAAEGNGT